MTGSPGAGLRAEIEHALRINQPETYRQLKASGGLDETLSLMNETATRALGQLIEAGLPLNQAMEIVREETYPSEMPSPEPEFELKLPGKSASPRPDATAPSPTPTPSADDLPKSKPAGT